MVEQPTRELSTRRRWATVIVTTLALGLSFISLLLGLGGIGGGDGQVTGAALGTGIAFMPLTFASAAFMSDHRRAGLAILAAVGAWMLVGMLVTLDVVLGLVAAYTAGCVVSLERPPGISWRTRIVVSAVFLAIVAVARVVVPGAVVITAPVVICLVVSFADDLAVHRAATSGSRRA